jgi:hypothetical protein
MYQAVSRHWLQVVMWWLLLLLCVTLSYTVSV